jgi:hypothetical protein
MPSISGYTAAIILTSQHEPEHEVAQRLLEVADEQGYDARVVEAQRGEHETGLSFRVPEDVAEKFNADRAERWPSKIENDDEKADEQGTRAVDGDGFAADNLRRAHDARVANSAAADNPTAPSARKGTGNKAQTAKE